MASGGAWTVQPFVSLSPSVSRQGIGDPFVLLLQLILTSTCTVHVRSRLLSRPLSFTPLPHSLPVTLDISPLTMATSLLIYPSPPHPSPPPLTTSPPSTGVWSLPGYVSLWSECTSMSTATVAHSPLQPPPPPPTSK